MYTATNKKIGSMKRTEKDYRHGAKYNNISSAYVMYLIVGDVF